MQSTESVLRDMQPTLERIEVDRLDYLQRRNDCLLKLILPGTVIFIFGVILFFPLGVFLLMLWIVAAAILYHVMAGRKGAAYVASYKGSVIGKLVGLVSPDLRYDQHAGISQERFVESELFNTRPDRYQTEDLIHGTYGKTSLQLAELHAEERRTSRDSDGNTETRYVTIFRGLLLIADFNKHFHGRTFIFPDAAERFFGDFGRTLQKMGGRSGTSLVQMDSPEFEEAFAVHATDQVEARYILSPSMMERILLLRNQFGKDVRIAFKGSHVWIAVPHPKPFLEPDKGVSAVDPVQVGKMLDQVRSFLEMVEELDLNTRIWTKE